MDFTLVTYNIFCREKLIFKDAQNTRAQLIPERLMNFEPTLDCLLIQEIFNESSEKILDKRMADMDILYRSKKVANSPFLSGLCFKKIIEDGGVKIYSKHPIVKEDHLIFESKEGINAIAGKGCGYAKIKKDNTMFHVFNTHLQAGGTAKTRINQLKEIGLFILKQEIPDTELIILGGDFNMDNIPELEKILEMKNVRLDMDTFNPEKNQIQKRASPEKADDEFPDRRLIDHIFIKNYQNIIDNKSIFTNLKSIEPYKIRMPTEKRNSNSCFPWLKYLYKYGKYENLTALSDHEPIFAYLKID